MLKEHGMKARLLEVTPKTLSFVPCGWICAEISRNSDEQIYGYRKSVFIKNRENTEAFRWAMLSSAATNTEVTNTKMKEIYQAMAASLPLDDTVPECDESAVARPGGA